MRWLILLVATSLACGDRGPEGACAEAPYPGIAEAIEAGCDTCPPGWWTRRGAGPRPGEEALATVQVPVEIEDGRATWRRSALDGRIVLAVRGGAFTLEVPGLLASDLAWVPDGDRVEVRRGERPGSVTLRQVDGTFIFQSRDALAPTELFEDGAELVSGEGITVRADTDGASTCTAVISPCWTLGLRGAQLTAEGIAEPIAVDVGETGRTTVAGRSYAFRGTFHYGAGLITATCLDLRFVGEGASWLAATSE